ncbi:spore germination protein GerPB [Sutcliffiella cohnii]|uniref:Spore gernimation protein n=1 Tax=Sutcliffiella cohnii TaxID=33932 RepID=A0A223KMF9_9BACI|nr:MULTISPECIES: spore germination protein GerPB [Sutcliffiella]AST90548.1 spore gernimation protein [Sutcliffiella cohnii]MED4016831.1 spore germination protein GerPB [Sutcliffiella cohnii]WBL16198.1 spore germination protein GerPB [Sutcliffiella sp. NC1]
MATNFFIHQNINIHQIRIGGVSNSSIFQIGSAGVIKSLSNLYNTGGYTEPAPEASPIVGDEITQGGPFVPLVPPTI